MLNLKNNYLTFGGTCLLVLLPKVRLEEQPGETFSLALSEGRPAPLKFTHQHFISSEVAVLQLVMCSIISWQCGSC